MATDKGLTQLVERLEESGARAELAANNLFASIDPASLAAQPVGAVEAVRPRLSEILSRAAAEARGHVGRWSMRFGAEATRVDLVVSELRVLEFELNALLDRLGASVEGFVFSAQARGAAAGTIVNTIDRALDGLSGSRIRSDIVAIGDLMARAVAGVARATHIDAFDIDEEAPVIWVAALVNTCPDCLPRHGQMRSLAEWQESGFPASGWSFCDSDCQCQILPRDVGFGIPVVRRAGRRATRRRLAA